MNKSNIMASNTHDNVVDDLLQCSVCMEQYEESGSRTPKVLPCQHSFCVGCLNAISSRGSIRCPNCRKDFATSVEDLSRSLVLIQLLAARETIVTVNSENDVSNIPKLLKEKYRDPEKAKECLSKLLDRMQNENRFNLDEIEAVLKCMQHYRVSNQICLTIQLTTVSYVNKVVFVGRGSMSQQLISEISSELITTMEVFKNNKLSTELLQNCVIALSAIDYIYDLTSHRNMRLADLLMEILATKKNSTCQERFIGLLENVCRNLSRPDNAIIGSRQNVLILLAILRTKVNSKLRDSTFIRLLSLFISMTDETPSTSRNIVNCGGLALFAQLLKNEDLSSGIKDDILINLSNWSELPELRFHFLDDNGVLVRHIKNLVRSDNQRVSFCAVSVLSRLLTINFKEWEKLTKSSTLRKEVLIDMYNCVMAWDKSASSLNVKFRSLKPFYPLLERYDAPPLQLFAVWTIRYFCLMNAEIYQEMLIKEEGIDYLLELKQNPYTDKNVATLAEQTLKSIH